VRGLVFEESGLPSKGEAARVAPSHKSAYLQDTFS